MKLRLAKNLKVRRITKPQDLAFVDHDYLEYEEVQWKVQLRPHHNVYLFPRNKQLRRAITFAYRSRLQVEAKRDDEI